ncbi:mannosyl-oligosaccharide alpha-1-2-mannosidase 1B [Penicillium maclennaniae]|uniref:mannosyl-oligosaccharide alpha-1-2-mannosidase 1B n=1 Tax=Penicillium maclennaniae TaxID=1343394 RepID=UPI002541D898|nr:mannosyl-oligosaccharide alpha-1-2-mannosidase 1B [Penicillium maclennaniae]KAJ5662382.1 mannosyl-oligosaccharide alpha-1-2-mannosidase 1B [Penicillium maclennaniae]
MVIVSRALLALAALVPAVAARPSQTCRKVQYDFPASTNKNDPRAEAVKQAYVREWDQYYKYAFSHDDLLPLTHNGTNDLFGWGASVVDAIDTAIVMGLTDIVEKQLKHIASVDFTKSAYIVNFFDINIRYLGGLLSAYDLIKSGKFPNPYDEHLVEALLSQAKSLATAISPVFDTVTGLPASQINLTTGEVIQSSSTINGTTYNSTNTAQAGTMILEYYRLSDLTGDETFREHAKKAESYLINPRPAPIYPGLVGTELDTDTGKFITFDAGWEAGVDSFIEYLIKTYLYDPSDEYTQQLRDFWVITAESSIQNIALHPYHHPELTFLSQSDTNGSLMWTMDDYSCFAGGNLLLGGAYLDRPDISDLGVKMADSCHWLFNTTTTGLNPSTIAWYNQNNTAYDNEYNLNATYRAEAAKNGYFITDPSYRDYPEPIESIWYAYRITGDTRWQDYNWEIFQALDTERSKSTPYAEISDVNAPGGGELINYVAR